MILIYATAKLTILNIATTHIAGDVLENLPVNIFIKAYDTNAKAIPLLMLYVRGIEIIAKIAGADSDMSFHSMSVMFLINRTETKSRAAHQFVWANLLL